MTQKSNKCKTQDTTSYRISKNEGIFAMVKTNEGINICCGKYRVSNKTFKSYEEAEKYIYSKPYELIINVCVLITKLNQDEKEETNTKESAKDD